MAAELKAAEDVDQVLPGSLANLLANANYARDVQNFITNTYASDPRNTLKPAKGYTQGAIEAIADHLKNVASQLVMFVNYQSAVLDDTIKTVTEIDTKVRATRRVQGYKTFRKTEGVRAALRGKKKVKASIEDSPPLMGKFYWNQVTFDGSSPNTDYNADEKNFGEYKGEAAIKRGQVASATLPSKLSGTGSFSGTLPLNNPGMSTTGSMTGLGPPPSVNTGLGLGPPPVVGGLGAPPAVSTFGLGPPPVVGLGPPPTVGFGPPPVSPVQSFAPPPAVSTYAPPPPPSVPSFGGPPAIQTFAPPPPPSISSAPPPPSPVMVAPPPPAPVAAPAPPAPAAPAAGAPPPPPPPAAGPPPPPPPAPAAPAPGRAAAGGGDKGDLLAAIRAGKQLRKVEPASPAASGDAPPAGDRPASSSNAASPAAARAGARRAPAPLTMQEEMAARLARRGRRTFNEE